MEKWKETEKKFIDIQKELRADCEQYIMDCFKKKYNTDELDYSKQYYLHIIEDEYEGRPMIAYDGGNHPEYASEMYNEVYGIGFFENGKIYIDTEECENYSIERVGTDDLINICYALENSMDYNINQKS